MTTKTTPVRVLKLGGARGARPDLAVENLAARLARGERWVLVHGASAATDTLAERLGVPVRRLEGAGGLSSRYNNAAMIEVFATATAMENQRLTAALVQQGVRAVGLAGPAIVRARRKGAIRAVVDGRRLVVRDDHSGTPERIDAAAIGALLDAGLLPVVAPLALGDEGEMLNVDGDLVAARIAEALQARDFVILTNVPGLLRDPARPDSLIARIRAAHLAEYEGIARGRMRRKLEAAEASGCARVVLADGRRDGPIDAALDGAGTHILREELDEHQRSA